MASRKRVPFNIDAFMERLGDKTKRCKCSKQCFKTLPRTALEKHAKAVDLYRTLETTPDVRGRVYWAWVLSLYALCLNDSGNVTGLRLPSFPGKVFCQSSWLEMLDINALRPLAREKVCQFIRSLATRHAHILPFYLSAAGGGELSPEDSVCIFPPSFSMRGMHSTYLDSIENNTNLIVSRRQFNNILKENLPYIRVSRSERGICDLCMAYRTKLRMVDDEKVTQLSEAWGVHLTLAFDSRDEHNICRGIASTMWAAVSNNNVQRADLSIDYAKQAYIPVIPAGTVRDLFHVSTQSSAQHKSYTYIWIRAADKTRITSCSDTAF